MTMMLYPASPEAATRFLKFVNASPTPFHAVHNAAVRLEKAGFQKVATRSVTFRSSRILINLTQILEKDDWEKNAQPGGKYYFTR